MKFEASSGLRLGKRWAALVLGLAATGALAGAGLYPLAGKTIFGSPLTAWQLVRLGAGEGALFFGMWAPAMAFAWLWHEARSARRNGRTASPEAVEKIITANK